jgi:hypothetical protein
MIPGMREYVWGISGSIQHRSHGFGVFRLLNRTGGICYAGSSWLSSFERGFLLASPDIKDHYMVLFMLDVDSQYSGI